jgi:hypothetical protein
MPKAARDDAMTRLSPADRDHLRHLMQDVRTHTAASRPGDTVRQMLTAQGHTLSPGLRTALEGRRGAGCHGTPGGHVSPRLLPQTTRHRGTRPPVQFSGTAAGSPGLWQLHLTALPGPGGAPGRHLSSLP